MPARSHYDPKTQSRAVRMRANRLEEADGVSKAQARREVGEVLGIHQARLQNRGMTPSTPAVRPPLLPRPRSHAPSWRQATEHQY